MKKIIFLAVVVTFVFFVYLLNIDKKVYFLALGDSLAVGTNSFNEEVYGYTDYIRDYLESNNKLEKYIKQYATNGYRVADIMNDINYNKKLVVNNEEITIKNALVKADVLTLSIGSNDLLNHLKYNEKSNEYIDEVINDIDSLLNIIRKYCKEDIFIIGFYNPFYYINDMNESIEYANKLLKEVSNKYNINYIEVSDLFKDNKYLPNPLNIHPSKEGYLYISKRIIKEIEKKVF